jgi:4-diphosphocytidyl-2-C-methyl-D-erythritol kinase
VAGLPGGKQVLVALAPAKINLTLEVLGKRPDGYHEIRSIIQTISLCDSFCFEPAEKLEFRSDYPGWDSEQSLVSKAARLLQQETGCSKGAIISVGKRIPMVGGLGGDSSDAATVLRGLNQIWELDLSTEKLADLAAKLGSDVVFFLFGGTALMEGRGEKITPLPPAPHTYVLLAIPPVPRIEGKTGLLYSSLTKNHFTNGEFTDKMVEKINKGEDFSLFSFIFNTFENVSFTPYSTVAVSRQHLQKMGADNVHLAGSGPTLFIPVNNRKEAESLFAHMQQQSLEPFLTSTLPSLEPVENIA